MYFIKWGKRKNRRKNLMLKQYFYIITTILSMILFTACSKEDSSTGSGSGSGGAGQTCTYDLADVEGTWRLSSGQSSATITPNTDVSILDGWTEVANPMHLSIEIDGDNEPLSAQFNHLHVNSTVEETTFFLSESSYWSGSGDMFIEITCDTEDLNSCSSYLFYYTDYMVVALDSLTSVDWATSSGTYSLIIDPFNEESSNIGATFILESDEEFIDVGNGVWNEGEEFTDLNGNSIWDMACWHIINEEWNSDFLTEESCVDAGHSWVEEEFTDLANGIYDEGEEFTDLNENNLWDDSYTMETGSVSITPSNPIFIETIDTPASWDQSYITLNNGGAVVHYNTLDCSLINPENEYDCYYEGCDIVLADAEDISSLNGCQNIDCGSLEEEECFYWNACVWEVGTDMCMSYEESSEPLPSEWELDCNELVFTTYYIAEDGTTNNYQSRFDISLNETFDQMTISLSQNLCDLYYTIGDDCDAFNEPAADFYGLIAGQIEEILTTSSLVYSVDETPNMRLEGLRLVDNPIARPAILKSFRRK